MNKTMGWGLGIVLALLVASNGAAEPLSREQQLALSTRTYAKSPAEIFAAVERLFLLADKQKDLTLTYPDAETMVVDRRHSALVLNVRYRWTIKVTPVRQRSQVNVALNTAAAGAFSRPGGGSPTVFPDALKLFYARLDVLLGQGGEWLSCKAYQQQVPDHGIVDALCAGADDRQP